MDWTNDSITLHKTSHDKLHLDDTYRYLSVFLLSHCTGFSIYKSVEILKTIGHGSVKSSDIRFTSTNILGYYPVGRGNYGIKTWNSMRDKTQQLDELERTAFSVVKKVFFGSTNLIATLDDDLFGTRSVYNQFKTLSNRKADKEGHTADVIADALLRVVLRMRFRRRGEGLEKPVADMMSVLMGGRGEEAFNGLTITADRGYGKESIIGTLSKCGAGSMVVFPDHLLRCHPFVCKSYFQVKRSDEVESHQGNVQASETTAASPDNSVTHPPQIVDRQYDRKRSFVIDDDPDQSPQAFHSFKRARRGQKNIQAIAVRERGTEKYANILQFFFQLPDSMADMIDSWIAVPRANVYREHLFYESIKKKVSTDGDGEIQNAIDWNEDEDVGQGDAAQQGPSHNTDEQKLKSALNEFVEMHCNALTVSQRSADWFLMRQFRITGTNAGKLLLSHGNFRSLVGMNRNAPERTLAEWASTIVQSWFSTSQSTEAMKRGSLNEEAFMSALKSHPLVYRAYECGMSSLKDRDYRACSPDGIALLDLSHVMDIYVSGPHRKIVFEEATCGCYD